MERIEFEVRANDCKDAIKGIVNRYSYLGRDAQEDIRQECYMAICKAMDLYNPELGSFVGYATKWIRSFVYDYINKVHSPVSISRETNRKIRAIRDCMEANPNLDIDGIAALTGFSRSVVLEYKDGFKKSSLDAPIDEAEDLSLLDTISDTSGEDRARREAISYLFNRIEALLKEDEQELLFSFYGINTKKLTQAELAVRFGITHQAVSKRINSIIKRLQSAMATDCSLFDFYRERELVS